MAPYVRLRCKGKVWRRGPGCKTAGRRDAGASEPAPEAANPSGAPWVHLVQKSLDKTRTRGEGMTENTVEAAQGLGRMCGKSVVVTRAAKGIGRATAGLFAREGARLVVNDVDETGLEDLRRRLAERRSRPSSGTCRW